MMKKLVVEDDNEGLMSLLGEKVTLLCCRYIYTGKLAGVNETCVKLEDAGIVYDTGSWDRKEYEDIQKLPNDIYVQTSSIESFGNWK